MKRALKLKKMEKMCMVEGTKTPNGGAGFSQNFYPMSTAFLGLIIFLMRSTICAQGGQASNPTPGSLGPNPQMK